MKVFSALSLLSLAAACQAKTEPNATTNSAPKLEAQDKAELSCDVVVPDGINPYGHRVDRFGLKLEKGSKASWQTFANKPGGVAPYAFSVESATPIKCSGFLNKAKDCSRIEIMDLPPAGVAERWRFQIDLEKLNSAAPVVTKVLIKSKAHPTDVPDFRQFSYKKNFTCVKRVAN